MALRARSPASLAPAQRLMPCVCLRRCSGASRWACRRPSPSASSTACRCRHFSGMGSSEAAASFISTLARARHGDDRSGFHGLD
eukprot:1837951-Alexandrium_andersonii.AAC.1